VQPVLGGDLVLSFGGLSRGGLGRGMPGSGGLARETAAELGARRGGLGLGTTAPSVRSALTRALRYLIPYRGWIAIYLAFWLISRSTSDVDALQNFMGHGINGIVTSLGTYLVVVAMAWHLSWRLTLLSMLAIPALLWSAVSYGRAVRPLFGTVQQAYGRLTGT